MITVVRKLPRGVKLSQHLNEHAPFYVMITLYRVPYYIAATPKVRQLLELDMNGKDAHRDR